jgi:hypothetical protein
MCGAELAYVVRGTTYSKATSVEVRGVYDGGLFYAHTRESGGCGAAWHRWPEEPASPAHYYHQTLRQKAEPYVREWNERNCQQQEGNE